MKKYSTSLLSLTVIVLFSAIAFVGCSPTIELTSSWHDQALQGKKFNKIVVLALGKSLAHRQMGEDNLVAALKAKGFNAVTGLSILPPNYSQLDSTAVESALIKNGIDGAITVRAVSVHESQRYVPGTTYGGYGYPYGYGHWGGYYSSYGYYSSPGYTVTDVEVLLETNLYDLKTNQLLWIGQSKSFTTDVTDQLAAQYASQVVNDLVAKKVITP